MKTDYKYEEIMHGIYQIQDEHEFCSTLVVGQKKAILFDTMLGLGDLKGFISQLTNLPVTVINSHGHFDHMGGNCQFEEVYLHEKDFEILPSLSKYIPQLEKSLKQPLENLRKSYINPQNLKVLDPHAVYDLGGLTVEVVELPGHTAGCIGLLIKEYRLLLAGDAATPQMCLFMDGAQSLEVYQDTLRKMQDLPFDSFLLGHFLHLFPKEILDKFMECTTIVGKKKGHLLPYTLIPSYVGTVYFLEMRNPTINDIICIIMKREDE